MDNIDFVVTWVDEADKSWQVSKNSYSKGYSKELNDEARFREWDTLRYWFRAVERFAPWVHRIFFITEGHIPEWLNTNHPKLVCVKHSDYIEKQYLPTFNSNVIELNIHRISQLGEHFVLFNDDTFINRPVQKKDFFIKGVPRDTGIFSPVVPRRNSIDTTVLNNVEIINCYFTTYEILKGNLTKFFNLKYGKYNVKNFSVLPWQRILGFYDTHIPVSYNKSCFRKIWNLEASELSNVNKNRFRTEKDLNHWLIRYWQLSTGNFIPRSVYFGKYYNITDDPSSIIEEIISSKHHLICLNDNERLHNFEEVRREIDTAFQGKFEFKSEYEK